MADYKNIKGFNIQYLDSDPPNPIEGQMWFNSTSQTLKGVEAGGAPAGTWASGGSLNTGTNSQVGAGTQTAALNISGSSTARTTVVESYDGSSWSTVTSVNVARNEAGGCGTQTAALFVGGTSNNTPAIEGNTELYNGTSWTEVNNMTSARDNLVQAFGTQTASIVAGGAPGPVATFTESWNGTSWTEVSDLPAPRALAAQTGTQTAGLLISGFTTLPAYARPTSVLSWNGSSWTEIADVNSGRDRSLASGIQTAALFAGGRLAPHPPSGVTGVTESWDGTSWSEQNDMSTARWAGAGTPAGGTQASLFAGGNNDVSALSITEEWTAPDILVKTFTTS